MRPNPLGSCFHSEKVVENNFRFIYDYRVAGCSLLSIPEGKWRTFTRLVYVHFGVATLLFMFGIICFCVGMQYSGMYNEVVSFSGLFALRTLHLHWPAFIHCVGLWLMLLMMLVPIVDSAFASSRWFDRAKRPLDSWATNFSWIDLTLSLIACINGFSFPLTYFVAYHT
uniref:Cytochrome c oxidase subunit 1 n=1 Tax=Parascaris equorum TaxID=6256 RepID=A0A914S057_PAREQ